MLDDTETSSLKGTSPYYVLDLLIRSLALRDFNKRSYYEKQKGQEKTLFKSMALNDGENGGDIGYIYFSNMPTQSTPLTSLPVLEEKVVFSELKGL